MAAEKRMISRAVITSDEFLELSFEAQALYFQLTIEADNFGFVAGVNRIVRGAGAKIEALNELERSFFVLRFGSGVIVVRHWLVANFGDGFSKPDRTITTQYIDELRQLDVDPMGAYLLMDSRRTPDGLQTDSAGTPIVIVNTYSSSIQYKAKQYINKVLAMQAQNKAIAESMSTSMSTSTANDDTDGSGEQNPGNGSTPAVDEKGSEKGTISQRIRDAVETYWPGPVTQSLFDLICRYQVYAGFGDDLIIFAMMKVQAMEPSKPEGYLATVLKSYRERGFTTAEEARIAEVERYEERQEADC